VPAAGAVDVLPDAVDDVGLAVTVTVELGVVGVLADDEQPATTAAQATAAVMMASRAARAGRAVTDCSVAELPVADRAADRNRATENTDVPFI
jgi:hypothetical protein